MKKELVYIALFLSLALIAVSILIFLKVFYDGQAYSQPIQEPIYHDFCGTPNSTEAEVLGKEIYNTYCSACHFRRTAKHNYLKGVSERFGEKFVISYIIAEDSLLKAKNKMASERNDFWGGNSYTHTFKLTTKEVKAVLDYMNH